MLKIVPEIQDELNSKWLPPKVFKNALSPSDLAWLLNDEENNHCKKVLPGRVFGLDTSKAFSYLQDRINGILDYPFKVTGGNYFRTNVPYRLHADTGIDEHAKLYRIIVFPLQFKYDNNYHEEFNSLTIMDQRWYHQAAFFMKGNEDQFAVKKQEYNQPVSDYTEIINKSPYPFPIDLYDSQFNHISYANFEGMSELLRVPWVPGHIITFDRSHIHTTTNFFKANITQKIGLTFFTEYSS